MQWGLKDLKTLTIIIGKDVELGDSFPEEGLLPPTLTYLEIGWSPNLKGLNGKGIQHLTSLKLLEISECPELRCLPEERLPASLLVLNVYGSPVLARDWHKISHIPTT